MTGPFDQDAAGNAAPDPQDQPPSAEIIAWRKRTEGLPWLDSDAAIGQIYDQVLEAKTIEEVGSELEGRSITKLGLVGERLILKSFALAPSTLDTKLGTYAAVEAVNPDGEVVVFSVGGKCLVQLVRWHELGAFAEGAPPLRVKVVQAVASRPGQSGALGFVIV